MKPEQLKEEINKLDLSEKLLLVEDIWDSIAISNNDIPVADWQKKELDKRYQEYQEGKLKLHDWEGVHEDLRKKYKQ